MRRAVLSDIGNVMIRVRHEYFLQCLSAKTSLDQSAIKCVIDAASAVEHEVSGGLKTIRQAFDEYVAHSLDIEWADFKAAWLSVLGEDIPQVRQAYENLTVPLYVLSNTNDVHAEYLHGSWFDEICVELWLSNEIGLVKPDPAIYEFALSKIGIAPHQLLFFDDLKENVDSALSLGIDAVLVSNPDDVVNALRSHNLIS